MHLEIAAMVVILVVLGVAFSYVTRYVTGESEAEWAFKGFSRTNFTIRMLLMFGIVGGGIVWLIYRYAKRAKFPVAIGSALIAAVIMTMSEVFYYAIPIVVLVAISLTRLKGRKGGVRDIVEPTAVKRTWFGGR